jgi:hypothetical protein
MRHREVSTFATGPCRLPLDLVVRAARCVFRIPPLVQDRSCSFKGVRAREDQVETGKECIALVMSAHLIGKQVNERIVRRITLRPRFDNGGENGRSIRFAELVARSGGRLRSRAKEVLSKRRHALE